MGFYCSQVAAQAPAPRAHFRADSEEWNAFCQRNGKWVLTLCACACMYGSVHGFSLFDLKYPSPISGWHGCS